MSHSHIGYFHHIFVTNQLVLFSLNCYCHIIQVNKIEFKSLKTFYQGDFFCYIKIVFFSSESRVFFHCNHNNQITSTIIRMFISFIINFDLFFLRKTLLDCNINNFILSDCLFSFTNFTNGFLIDDFTFPFTGWTGLLTLRIHSWSDLD